MSSIEDLQGRRGLDVLAAIRYFARHTGSAGVIPIVPSGTIESLKPDQRLFLAEAFRQNVFSDILDEEGHSLANSLGLNSKEKDGNISLGAVPKIRSRA